MTSIFDEQGVEASGQERFIAETFCTPRRPVASTARSTGSSATTTSGCTRSRTLAYKRGAYGYALFED